MARVVCSHEIGGPEVLRIYLSGWFTPKDLTPAGCEGTRKCMATGLWASSSRKRLDRRAGGGVAFTQVRREGGKR